MDTRKEQERAELHRAIWSIADALRGAVAGWDFKQYVLGMLFYRYISENLTAYANACEREIGDTTFDYAALPDEAVSEQARAHLVNKKGFFILPSQLFANVRKRAARDENLNETLSAAFRAIERSALGQESEEDFKGLFADFDVNGLQLGESVAKRNERLRKLMDGVGEMRLGNYQDNAIDAFGDAYEFLIAMYASNAGKSGGEFFTPQEVSELLTRIAVDGRESVNKVYDPACGSGSLLLKAVKVLGRDKVRNGFYGQEINLTTYNLCRINMFLHDIPYDRWATPSPTPNIGTTSPSRPSSPIHPTPSAGKARTTPPSSTTPASPPPASSPRPPRPTSPSSSTASPGSPPTAWPPSSASPASSTAAAPRPRSAPGS